ncbi:MAG: hypothetical protein JJU41_08815 [Bacteroidetes bacterium]|nr:hypothetical protein [Bacteroidota bacterium]MCH8525106.1 hypothetical protein [Balneolales bacterium]
MGRAMLFLVTGSFIIFGIVELGLFGKQASMNEINVQSVLTAQARNVANSGLERAVNQLVADETWRAEPGNPTRFSFGDEFADVVVVDDTMIGITLPPNIVEIRSIGSSGNRQATAVAQIEVTSGLPEVNSTMGVFTDNLNLTISGNAFEIDGNDLNPDNPTAALPGFAVNSQAAYDEIMKLRANQLGNITGAITGSGPSILLDSSMDFSPMEDFVNISVANADVVHTLTYRAVDGSMGTFENPKIVVVDNNSTLEVEGGMTGAGIIIVKAGSTLKVRGNFEFDGLIIVQGAADIGGTPAIRGAMVFGGVNPAININFQLLGNSSILYDSRALNNLSTKMPQTAGTGQRILAIFD